MNAPLRHLVAAAAAYRPARLGPLTKRRERPGVDVETFLAGKRLEEQAYAEKRQGELDRWPVRREPLPPTPPRLLNLEVDGKFEVTGREGRLKRDAYEARRQEASSNRKKNPHYYEARRINVDELGRERPVWPPPREVAR